MSHSLPTLVIINTHLTTTQRCHVGSKTPINILSSLMHSYLQLGVMTLSFWCCHISAFFPFLHFLGSRCQCSPLSSRWQPGQSGDTSVYKPRPRNHSPANECQDFPFKLRPCTLRSGIWLARWYVHYAHHTPQWMHLRSWMDGTDAFYSMGGVVRNVNYWAKEIFSKRHSCNHNIRWQRHILPDIFNSV